MHLTDLADDCSAAGLPDLAQVVLARDVAAVAANMVLSRVVARHYLIRLLRLVRRLEDKQSGAPVLSMLRRHLAEMDVDQALTWAVRPEVTGWIWRMEAAGTDANVGLLTNPTALALNNCTPLAVVRLSPACPPVPVVTRHGSAGEARLLAWAEEGDESPLDLDAAAARDFASAIQSGADLLTRSWPEGSELVGTDIKAFAALGARWGLRPSNFSIHGLRGLVLTSIRPAYMLAQTLVHEATHQRFSGILDCVAVVHNPKATHYSPFVDQTRPVGHLLHGILSFINDIHAADRWAPYETDPLERNRLERYRCTKTGQVKLALRNLLEVAEPTRHGSQLIDGCKSALGTIGNV